MEESKNVVLSVAGGLKPEHSMFLSSFGDIGLDVLLLRQLHESGCMALTEVQKGAIPLIMKGADVLVRAPEGYGKTAAYLLPIMHKILRNLDVDVVEDTCKPQALILVPNPFNAEVIMVEFMKFATYTKLKCAGCYEKVQVAQFQRDVQVVVATPQQITRVLETNALDLSSMKFVVLDQLDLLLRLELHLEVAQILNHFTMAPKRQRQVLIFTETMPNRVERVVSDVLKPNFEKYYTKVPAFRNVAQNFVTSPARQKPLRLEDIIKVHDAKNCVVFTEDGTAADHLAYWLNQEGYEAVSLHKGTPRAKRREKLKQFRDDRTCLIITDNIASLPLKTKFLNHAINYDMPRDVGEYVHRIGLISREWGRGISTTFFSPNIDAILAPQYVHVFENWSRKVPECLEKASKE